ncbi:MAG: hypothetical protein K2W95_09455 [Candidatus Obscuribacterales bacterium]|nr:hypothetical protein [Candidatus Obscuribacterales bacterium]
MENEDFEMEKDLAIEGEEEGDEGGEAGDLADEGASSLRLAEEAAAGIAEGVTAAARAGKEQHKPGEVTAEGIISAEDKAELLKKLENFDGKKMSPEAFLSRTERMLLNSVHDAVTSGDLKSAQDMLAAVAENPKSVKRVMEALKERLEGKFTSVSWESGTDNKGNAFVRLHIANSNPFDRETTRVMVGSDGTHSATVSRPRGGEVATDPAGALSDMYPQRRIKPEPRWENHRPLPEDRTQPLDHIRQLQERGYKPGEAVPNERKRR